MNTRRSINLPNSNIEYDVRIRFEPEILMYILRIDNSIVVFTHNVMGVYQVY